MSLVGVRDIIGTTRENSSIYAITINNAVAIDEDGKHLF